MSHSTQSEQGTGTGRQNQGLDALQRMAIAGVLTDVEISALLCTDQRRRWENGDRVPTELYLNDKFKLSAEVCADLVYQEFLMREQLGQRPSTEEYLRRFPNLAHALEPQFELHSALTVTETSGVDGWSAPNSPGNARSKSQAWPCIERYTIISEVACGGMGIVYRARQWGLNRTVALKFVKDSAEASPIELVRFLSEAEAVAQLQHPHIVQIYDIGEHDGYTYLAFEYVEGGSLEEAIASDCLKVNQAAGIIEKVARAVHFAHQKGIVHRDLKPANILLTAEGEPKISDFGLAKRIELDSHLTGAGVLIGTPSYMSPEQAEGHVDEIGPSSDIYALGATLYFLLTGRPPFQASSAVRTLRQVIDEEPLAPRQLNAAINRDLETICLKCLEKQPHRRYASAADLSDDLNRYLRGRAILAHQTTWRESAWRWIQRNPGCAAATSIALTLLLVLCVTCTMLTYKLHQTRYAFREPRLRAEGVTAASVPFASSTESLALVRSPNVRPGSTNSVFPVRFSRGLQ